MARRPAKNVKMLPTLPEDEIHKAVVRHLTLLGNPACYWFHVPNGGSRNAAEAKKLKAMGTRAGVADLVLVIAGKTHFLELKKHGGRMSDAQKLAQSQVRMAGAVYAVAVGLDAAISQLREWGAILGGGGHIGRRPETAPVL